MSLRIQGNIDALMAARRLSTASDRSATAMERLSSGLRINRGADDAAGLGMSERMRAQSRGLSQSQRNIADAISHIQTAVGVLHEAHDSFQRLRELTLQIRNGTLRNPDRLEIVKEMFTILDGVLDLGRTAQFNGVALGTGATVTFQIGANDSDQLQVQMMDLVGVATDTYLPMSPSVLAQFDTKIDLISQARGQIGAVQNRLEHALAAGAVYEENLVAAESRIRDTDMAQGVVEVTRQQILAQSSQAMLSQALQNPRQVLSLLSA